ncbi:MAG: class I SAM-dependent methyltransferase [Anaerolineae bacterium]
MKKIARLYFADQRQIDFWDKVYDQDDVRGARYTQRMKLALACLDAAALPADGAVLDAGCGAGRVGMEVMRRGYQLYGLDFSHGMLARAREIHKGMSGLVLRLAQGDVESLPLGEACFDAVVCLGVISYLPGLDKALGEMSRVLKPGGILVVSFINRARVVRFLDLAGQTASRTRRLIARMSTTGSGGSRPAVDVRRRAYLIPRFFEALQRSGFTVLGYDTTPYEPLTFLGRAIYPRRFAAMLTGLMERPSGLPFIESVGGICVVKAQKRKTS